jgi:DNA invertase Pin-like site-specific DNA recombinase
MSINVAIYIRSSADCPFSTEEQSVRLRAVAEQNGWTAAKVFIDRPTTTKNGRERRPGQVALIQAVRSNFVGKVLLYSIDRLGRSPIDLIESLEVCRTHGVGLYVHEQNLDTTTNYAAGTNGAIPAFGSQGAI